MSPRRQGRGADSSLGPARPKLVHITTVPDSLWGFFRGQVKYFTDLGYDLETVSSPGELLARFQEREGIPVHEVTMTRTISPLRDLVSLVELVVTLRRIRPDIVDSHTPKGGLLGQIAAALAGVPVRVYHIRGLPMLTATGPRRFLLRLADRTACLLAQRVLCASPSTREIVVADGLCPPEKIAVLLRGTIQGVDAETRFNPELRSPAERRELRQSLGIPQDALVVGFIGRIVRDKGVRELTAAWRELREELPAAHLLVVGPFESQDPVGEDAESVLRTDPRVHLVDRVLDTVPYYSAMDVCALPTYREGFPGVPLEAAAMERPVVATNVPGCIDAVLDGVTGTLVPPRDPEALARALRRYLQDPALRAAHGTAGRQWVLRDFRPQTLWHALHLEYVKLLQREGLDRLVPPPAPPEPPVTTEAAAAPMGRAP